MGVVDDDVVVEVVLDGMGVIGDIRGGVICGVICDDDDDDDVVVVPVALVGTT